jgi:hypothetical protein
LTASHGERVIQLAVLDPLLYGAARAFDYLGFRGQDMLDKVGDGIIQYGLSEGYFERSNNLPQFVTNVGKFFVQNGYMSNASVKRDGNILEIQFGNYRFLPLMRKLRDRNSIMISCPICTAGNAITKSVGELCERISENVTEDGIWTIKLKIAPGTEHTERTVFASKPADLQSVRLGADLNDTIGTQAFQSIAYGLAYGFEFLGAQAQLLLDNVGSGMIEFMQEESKLAFPSPLEDALDVLSTFMSGGGLADTIHVQVSKGVVGVDFENSRYLPVLTRLLQEGRKLVSCPFTLAARSLIKARGLGVEDMSWKIEGENASLMMATVDLNEQEFNEESVGNIMDRV